MTLFVSSRRLPLSERSSPSTRARAMATSPASLTRRSIKSARTRSIATLAASASGGAAAAAGAATAGNGTTGPAATTASGTGAAGAGTAAVSSHGSGVFTSPFCRRSSTKASRSRSVSRVSNSAGVGLANASPASRRLSISCVSSPKRIAPAIRALPLNVCKLRRSACAASTLAGLCRHARSCSPACGKSSAASSRKIGSTCSSTSS